MSTEVVTRTEIAHDDPQFGGRLVSFWSAFTAEHQTASKAAQDAGQPIPSEYPFSVPEDPASRVQFMKDLLAALERSLESPNDLGKRSMTPEQAQAVISEIAKIMPLGAVESDSFPAFMRLRVDIFDKLLKAGFVEALGCIARAQYNIGGALFAAQALAREIPVARGSLAINKLDPGTWSDIIGERIISQDDKSNIPAKERDNLSLYERLFARSSNNSHSLLKRIIDIFNERADGFVQRRSGFSFRNNDFLRLQWYNILLTKLNRLILRGDIEDLAAEFNDIADRLEAAKNTNDFTKVINTIGLPKKAAN